MLYISADDILPTKRTLNIYDMNGKNLYTENLSPGSGSISSITDLNMLSAGLYVVGISSGEELKTYKIVIAK